MLHAHHFTANGTTRVPCTWNFIHRELAQQRLETQVPWGQQISLGMNAQGWAQEMEACASHALSSTGWPSVRSPSSVESCINYHVQIQAFRSLVGNNAPRVLTSQMVRGRVLSNITVSIIEYSLLNTANVLI